MDAIKLRQHPLLEQTLSFGHSYKMMTIANVHQIIASAKQCHFSLLGSRAHSIAYHPHSYIPSHPLWQGRTCPGGTTNPDLCLAVTGNDRILLKRQEIFSQQNHHDFFQLPIPSNQGRSSPILKWLATIPHAVGDLRDLRNLIQWNPLS